MRSAEIPPAVFSDDGQYRYLLRRAVGLSPRTCVFVMLNPSTADARVNDPTVRRCIYFASAWDYGILEVVNIFALRSTDPGILAGAQDPVGIQNDGYILEAAHRAYESDGLLVAAWGEHGALRERGLEVGETLRPYGLHCLGINASGQPKHPLYIPSVKRPMPFDPRLIERHGDA